MSELNTKQLNINTIRVCSKYAEFTSFPYRNLSDDQEQRYSDVVSNRATKYINEHGLTAIPEVPLISGVDLQGKNLYRRNTQDEAAKLEKFLANPVSQKSMKKLRNLLPPEQLQNASEDSINLSALTRGNLIQQQIPLVADRSSFVRAARVAQGRKLALGLDSNVTSGVTNRDKLNESIDILRDPKHRDVKNAIGSIGRKKRQLDTLDPNDVDTANRLVEEINQAAKIVRDNPESYAAIAKARDNVSQIRQVAKPVTYKQARVGSDPRKPYYYNVTDSLIDPARRLAESRGEIGVLDRADPSVYQDNLGRAAATINKGTDALLPRGDVIYKAKKSNPFRERHSDTMRNLDATREVVANPLKPRIRPLLRLEDTTLPQSDINLRSTSSNSSQVPLNIPRAIRDTPSNPPRSVPKAESPRTINTQIIRETTQVPHQGEQVVRIKGGGMNAGNLLVPGLVLGTGAALVGGQFLYNKYKEDEEKRKFEEQKKLYEKYL